MAMQLIWLCWTPAQSLVRPKAMPGCSCASPASVCLDSCSARPARNPSARRPPCHSARAQGRLARSAVFRSNPFQPSASASLGTLSFPEVDQELPQGHEASLLDPNYPILIQQMPNDSANHGIMSLLSLLSLIVFSIVIGWCEHEWLANWLL